jgi:phage terminase large subunit-like protein
MAKLKTKVEVPKEPIVVGPCSPAQQMVFDRAREVDFLLIGGSRGGGKSEVATQISLMYKDDPHYNGMYVRTEFPQLMGAGGLWEIATKYYPLFGAKARQNPSPMYTFPSGAKIRFRPVATTAEAEKLRGLQFSFIGIDEITQLEKEAVIAMLACLRSEADMNSFCLGTMNPHRDNWVFDLVKWYLDDQGYVDKEKNGKVRYFVVKDNNFIFAEYEDWFRENMPETVTGLNPNTGEEFYIPPKKFAFVQLTIFDNHILLKKNPRYLGELQNLPEHERAKQLYGNWFAESDTVKYFNRKMVRGQNGEKVKKALPLGCTKVRAWDKANTEFVLKLNNTDADFSACIGMAKCPEGKFYIYGDFHESNFDEHEKVYGKFRKSSGQRDQIMLNQAMHDGSDTTIVIATDAGADGKQVFQEMAKKFISKGFRVRSAPTAVQTQKFTRFEPFLMACEAGLVYIVEDSFPDARTLELFYKELEQFSPTLPDGRKWRSSRILKDDMCDSVSDAFNTLSKQQVLPTIVLPTLTKTNEFLF